MNINPFTTNYYEQNRLVLRPQNKPNPNPIKADPNPNKANFRPNFTANFLVLRLKKCVQSAQIAIKNNYYGQHRN